jgi:hypothetical protein
MRCDICFDPEKNCGNNCKGESCKNYSSCHRYLHPTIRITTKCTQSCTHCCFSCSPQKSDMMTVEVAKDIKKFLDTNNVSFSNIMGGEFYMNPEWYDVISLLAQGRKSRIVSNGDWASSPKISSLVISLLKKNPLLTIGISYDKWHTNKNVEKARKILTKNKINFKIADDSNRTTPESIVPIGKSSYSYSGLYSMFGCYCHNPEHKYSFMIDEVGEIYKCSFGIWNYDNIQNFISGGFAERFKEVGKKFQSVWISNCQRCAEASERSARNG